MQGVGGALQGVGGALQGVGGALQGVGGSLQGVGGSLQGVCVSVCAISLYMRDHWMTNMLAYTDQSTWLVPPGLTRQV